LRSYAQRRGATGWWKCGGMSPGQGTCGSYRVEIRGELGDQFGLLFPPMTLVRDHGFTVLTGPVGDQSQLLGLLGRIQEVGCELVSVKQLSSDP